MRRRSGGVARRLKGRAVPHYVWVGALLVGLMLVLHWVSRPTAEPGLVKVTTANALVPDLVGAVVKQVTLPHVLDDEDSRWQKRVDYDLPWPEALSYADRAEARLGLLLPRVGTRFRVLLNGHEVAQVGWYAEADRTINTAWFPYLVNLPAGLLAERPEYNRLQVQVQGQLLERSGLWPLQIGDYDRLFVRHRLLDLWQVMGTWMMTVIALLMGVMSLMLWAALRERLFLLMAAASFAHMVRLWLTVVLEPPMSFELYFFLHRASFTLYVGFFCLLMEELFGLRVLIIRWLSYFLLVVGPLWMVWILYTQLYDFYRVWAGLLALVAATSLTIMSVQLVRHGQLKQDQFLVLLVALFTLLTGVRDFLVVQLNFPGEADIRWMSVGGLALMLTLGWVLLQRATASAREVHRLNDTLAENVARRESELRTAFEQLRLSEQQRAVEGERRRLMRDMHDGLGSQLVQTLNAVRSSNGRLETSVVESMIHHALDELRMTLDSLEPMDGDLPTILGTLRQRVAPALEAACIELRWQVQEVPPLHRLDARGVMHLFRCVQEVFANVVKHAQASRVTVRTWADGQRVYLAVEDDGVGLPPPEQRRQGRGLNNIHLRAEKLGAQVRFYPTWPGTGVEFSFPIQHPGVNPSSDWARL